MTLIKNCKDLNHHSQLDASDENVHHPKGFLLAPIGGVGWRDADENIAYPQIAHFPSAINHVDGLSTPPTQVNGDIYLLKLAAIIHDVDTIVWQSGTTVRISFNGAPDLSGVAVGDHARIRLATNVSNIGTFIISDVNDGSDFIEITNEARPDNTDDEASDSPATTTTTDAAWDAVGDSDWVKYFAIEDKWFGITPEVGATSFNESSENDRVFKSTGWEEATGGAIGGSIAITQVAFGSGVDTIAGDTGFVWNNTSKTFSVGFTGFTSTRVAAKSATNGLDSFSFIGQNLAGTLTWIVGGNGNIGIGSGANLTTNKVNIAEMNRFRISNTNAVTPISDFSWFFDDVFKGAIQYNNLGSRFDFFAGGATNVDLGFTIGALGNVGMGANVWGTNARRVFAMSTNDAVEPTSSPSNIIQMYPKDIIPGQATLHIRTEGNDIIRWFPDSGWALPTGTSTKTTFDTATVTTEQLAERFKALIEHLFTSAGMGVLKA